MKIENTVVLPAGVNLRQRSNRMRQLIQRMALTMALTSLFTSAPAQQREVSPGGVQAPATAMSQAQGQRWIDVPTQTLSAGGVDFAYRELGKQHGGTRSPRKSS